MTVNKAIFLDLEGIIVTHRSILAQTAPHLGERYSGKAVGWARFVDDLSMRLVIRLAVLSHSKIVITSTLRSNPSILGILEMMCMRWAKFYQKDNGGEDLTYCASHPWWIPN